MAFLTDDYVVYLRDEFNLPLFPDYMCKMTNQEKDVWFVPDILEQLW